MFMSKIAKRFIASLVFLFREVTDHGAAELKLARARGCVQLLMYIANPRLPLCDQLIPRTFAGVQPGPDALVCVGIL